MCSFAGTKRIKVMGQIKESVDKEQKTSARADNRYNNDELHNEGATHLRARVAVGKKRAMRLALTLAVVLLARRASGEYQLSFLSSIQVGLWGQDAAENVGERFLRFFF